MIRKITLENFKLYDNSTTIGHLKPINLLTGINGRGKSTTLQPLLLFCQTLMRNRSSRQVYLNGDMVNLGNARDVKFVNSANDVPIRIGFTTDEETYAFELIANAENNQVLDVRKVTIGNEKGDKEYLIDGNSVMQDLLPSELYEGSKTEPYSDVIYISAERIGPRLQYNPSPLKDWIGHNGEYAIQQLHYHSSDEVTGVLVEGISALYPNEDMGQLQRTVRGLTEFWLSKMFGETTLESQYWEDAERYTLKMSTERIGAGQKFKPTNIGFGYSYVLSILIAGLTAKRGSVLIVENPESHLHPSAQSVITRFLALVAESGIQVFVESHSEHVLNALRVMVVQGAINTDDINVMYFDSSYEQQFRQIEMRQNGEMEEWPRHFFDQTELDLNIILGL